MIRPLLILIGVCFFESCFAQDSYAPTDNKVVVFKDHRLDILASKEAELNTALLKIQARNMQGFRLMILNTSDKDYAFKIRAELLKKFPEQKPYMWFANPYIRIKFGNFRTKEEADVYKKQISQMLGGASIYYIPETIELNWGDDFDPDIMK
ncbi:MAG: hypothetical protein ABI288_09245 [Ginsengibacter sp.]